MKFRVHFFGLVGFLILGGPSYLHATYLAGTSPATLNPTTLSLGATNGFQATSTLYSNITNFVGQGYVNGGASANATFGNTTAMVADDITTAAGSAGASVTSLTFSVASFNASTVTAGIQLYFYSDSTTTGGPGTLLGALSFNPIAITGGNVVSTFTYTSSTALFTVPTNGSFWVGESFSDFGGTTGATSAQLNALGEGLYNPPTVGSSNDVFFQSTTNSNLTNSPSGSFLYFGGSPVANFGFAFSGTPAVTVPEPSSLALASLAGLLLAGASRLAKRSSRLAS